MNFKDPFYTRLFRFVLFFTILIWVNSLPLNAQTDKRIAKADKLFKAGKTEKGIALMQKVVDEHPTDQNWSLLVNMYYERYEAGKNNGMEALLLSLSKSLDSTLKSVNMSSADVTYFGSLVSKCREATLYSQCGIASQLLRNYFIDYEPDTAVSEAAKTEFGVAENYFGKKDFGNAKTHYLKALKINPGYYKATIYAGDMYWYLKKPDSAIYYFRSGIEMYSNLLEPRKYLVDALLDANRDDEALRECLDAICVYPDEVMFNKLVNIIGGQAKRLNKHWMKRGCDVNSFKQRKFEPKEDVWRTYQNAMEDVKLYCDSSGIIKANSFTKEKYLEIYSWEKVLSSSAVLPPSFDFAKKMKAEGFLDCYVFVSLYHFDLYSQYADFVRSHREKVKLYMETYLMEKNTN